MVGDDDAVLAIDDTALPEACIRALSIARRRHRELGERANCQLLVAPTLARGGAHGADQA